jgi:hypothetical protein
MSVKKTMTFDEFKSTLIARFGEREVFFREVGKHGWTSVNDVLNKDPGGRVGPHWCDAEPHEGQRLLGHYDFNTQTATFFEVWDREKQAFVEQG